MFSRSLKMKGCGTDEGLDEDLGTQGDFIWASDVPQNPGTERVSLLGDFTTRGSLLFSRVVGLQRQGLLMVGKSSSPYH